MGRLFGTDGVRGLANDDLTVELALDLSVAAAHVLGDVGAFDTHGGRPRAVVGRDPRASGEFLEAAVVAGVDVVLMGAGIPAHIPALLDALSRNEPGSIPVDVDDAGDERFEATMDPRAIFGDDLPAVKRPVFLAIVATHVLAQYLARDEVTRPDGFVVEAPTAGGHNAPPRGKPVFDDDGQPVYGPRDAVEPEAEEPSKPAKPKTPAAKVKQAAGQPVGGDDDVRGLPLAARRLRLQEHLEDLVDLKAVRGLVRHGRRCQRHPRPLDRSLARPELGGPLARRPVGRGQQIGRAHV